MTRLTVPALLVGSTLWFGGCGPAPVVIQGTVVSYEKSSETLVVQDERRPGVTLTVSLKGAEVGAEAAPGDLVRVAYRETPAGHVATRVMNITRQDETARKAGKGSRASH